MCARACVDFWCNSSDRGCLYGSGSEEAAIELGGVIFAVRHPVAASFAASLVG